MQNYVEFYAGETAFDKNMANAKTVLGEAAGTLFTDYEAGYAAAKEAFDAYMKAFDAAIAKITAAKAEGKTEVKDLAAAAEAEIKALKEASTTASTKLAAVAAAEEKLDEVFKAIEDKTLTAENAKDSEVLKAAIAAAADAKAGKAPVEPEKPADTTSALEKFAADHAAEHAKIADQVKALNDAKKAYAALTYESDAKVVKEAKDALDTATTAFGTAVNDIFANAPRNEDAAIKLFKDTVAVIEEVLSVEVTNAGEKFVLSGKIDAQSVKKADDVAAAKFASLVTNPWKLGYATAVSTGAKAHFAEALDLTAQTVDLAAKTLKTDFTKADQEIVLSEDDNTVVTLKGVTVSFVTKDAELKQADGKPLYHHTEVTLKAAPDVFKTADVAKATDLNGLVKDALTASVTSFAGADNAKAAAAAHKTSKIEFAESKVSVTAGSAAKSLDLSQFDQNFTVDVNGSAEKFTNSQIHFSKDHKYTITINDMDSTGKASKALKGTATDADNAKLSSADGKNDKDITKVNMHKFDTTGLNADDKIVITAALFKDKNASMAGDVAETISKTENLGKDKASNNGIYTKNGIDPDVGMTKFSAKAGKLTFIDESGKIKLSNLGDALVLDTGDSGTLTVAQSSKKVGGTDGADGEKYIFSMVASYLQNAGGDNSEHTNTIFYFDVGDDLYIIHTGAKTGDTAGAAGTDDTYILLTGMAGHSVSIANQNDDSGQLVIDAIA